MTEPVADTTDLRRGAPVSDVLLALLPLVGVWQGDGVGRDPVSGEQVAFTQRFEIAHDGRPFLVHTARSWLADGTPGRRETGFWRPGDRGRDDVSLVVASEDGQAVVLSGVAGDERWELAATAAVAGPGGPQIDGERRLYVLRGGELFGLVEVARAGATFVPVSNVRLRRVDRSDPATHR